MEYLPTDAKSQAMLAFFAVLIIRFLWGWFRDTFIKRVKMVDDHDVKIAVHEEKHVHHEKRLDHLEDDRTKSQR